MDIETVAIYSEADKESLHVQIADEAYCVDTTISKESYLNLTNIISVAKLTGCDAIHPGYGFLAENADFAELCRECNLILSVKSRSYFKDGHKDVARDTMKEAGFRLYQVHKELLKIPKKRSNLRIKLDILLLLKRLQVAAEKVFVLRHEEELVKEFKLHSKKLVPLLGTLVYT